MGYFCLILFHSSHGFATTTSLNTGQHDHTQNLAIQGDPSKARHSVKDENSTPAPIPSSVVEFYVPAYFGEFFKKGAFQWKPKACVKLGTKRLLNSMTQQKTAILNGYKCIRHRND